MSATGASAAPFVGTGQGVHLQDSGRAGAALKARFVAVQPKRRVVIHEHQGIGATVESVRNLLRAGDDDVAARD